MNTRIKKWNTSKIRSEVYCKNNTLKTCQSLYKALYQSYSPARSAEGETYEDPSTETQNGL